MDNDTEKPPTLRQQIDDVAKRVRTLTDSVESDRRERSAARPSAIPEAATIADCVRALIALQESERSRSSPSYAMPFSNFPDRQTWPAGERVLRFLAARFGVSLIEVERQPCARQHVDELTPDQVLAALRNPQSVTW